MFRRTSFLAVLVLLVASAAETGRAQSPCAVPTDAFRRPGTDGATTSLVEFDDGQGPALYVAGQFSLAGEVTVSNIARLRGDDWTPLGSGISLGAGVVNELAAGDAGFGMRLYAGGQFTLAGGLPATNVAQWDGTAWSALGGGIPNGVFALTLYDDGSGPRLYAGTTNAVFRWAGAGWNQVGGAVSGRVEAFCVHDDGAGPKLHVGYVGASDGTSVARLDGAVWTTLGTFAPVGVVALASFDDGTGRKLYAANDTVQTSTPSVSRWTGTAWQTVGTYNGGAHRLATFDLMDGNGERLYVGGQKALSHWTGSTWATVGSNPMTAVHGLTISTSGGTRSLCSTSWNTDFWPPGLLTSRVQRLAGSTWTEIDAGAGIVFAPSANPYVSGVGAVTTAAGTELLLAGAHMCSGAELVNQATASWNGQRWVGITAPGLSSQARGFWKLALSGSLVTWAQSGGLWQRGPSSWIPLNYFVQGTVGGVAEYNFGSGPRLAVCTTAVTPTIPAPGGYPYAVMHEANGVPVGQGSLTSYGNDVAAYDDGTGPALYFAGAFSSVNSTPSTNGIARWSGGWSSVGGGIDGAGSISSLVVHDFGAGPELCAGGTFSSIGGMPISSVARWNGTSWSAIGAGVTNGGVAKLIVHDDGAGPRLYACGSFTLIGGVAANRVAAFDGVQWLPLGSGADGPVNTIASIDVGQGPTLWLTGNFTSVNGVTSRKVARLACGPFAGTATCFGDASHGPSPCPCGNVGAFGHGCGNASDPNGAYLSASGSAAPLDTVLFDVVGMPPIAPILFFQGDAAMPALPFGDGALCVSGTLTRLAIEFADAAGHVQHPTGADPALSVSGATPPGSALTRTYQGWYRTAAPLCGPATFNLTNGWRITW